MDDKALPPDPSWSQNVRNFLLGHVHVSIAPVEGNQGWRRPTLGRKGVQKRSSTPGDALCSPHGTSKFHVQVEFAII